MFISRLAYLSTAVSAIGHEAPALVLTKILNMAIKANRIRIQMKIGENALIFFRNFFNYFNRIQKFIL